MDLFFFEFNIREALLRVNSKTKAAALWYTKGLTSYNHLSRFMTIGTISIETDIAEQFQTDNPELCSKRQIEIVKTSNERIPALNPAPICFFASNDTIARSFKPVIDHLLKMGVDYALYCRDNEGAQKAAEKMGLKAIPVKHRIPKTERFSCLVLGNDWGLKERRINNDFLAKGLNSVCLQESSIDFNPADSRMKQCSFPIFQGSATLENINITNRIGAVIGNPRFEELVPAPLPKKEKLLANVNFTYGVFENARDSWVRDVVGACEELSMDYLLSQHPRDTGDLSKYNSIRSNPLLVHEGIRESTVVVSRFSALLTEAICLGRPAVYYNPHGENMHYKFETDNSMLYYARDRNALIGALHQVSENFRSANPVKSNFLEEHLGVTKDHTASLFIARCMVNVVGFAPIKKKATVLQIGKLYGRIAKRILEGNQY